TYSDHGKLARHLRFCHRASAALATSVFHGMVIHRAKLERRQAFLFRAVDVANDLFAMAASIARARHLRSIGDVHAESAADLADVFALGARRRIRRALAGLFDNDDAVNTAFGAGILDGAEAWIEDVPGLPPAKTPARSEFPPVQTP